MVITLHGCIAVDVEGIARGRHRGNRVTVLGFIDVDAYVLLPGPTVFILRQLMVLLR